MTATSCRQYQSLEVVHPVSAARQVHGVSLLESPPQLSPHSQVSYLSFNIFWALEVTRQAVM